jgi:glycogen synthase
MNILIVTESFPPHAGGSGWSSFHLAKALIGEGHQVTVAKINGKETEYEGVEIIPVIPRSNTRLFKEVFLSHMRKQIQKIVDERNIDVVHSQHMLSTMMIAKVKDARKIATLRDYWPVSYSGMLFNIKNRKSYSPTIIHEIKSMFAERGVLGLLVSPYMLFRTWRSHKCLKKMDKVVCISDFVQSIIRGHGVDDKLSTIYNPVNVEELSKIKPKKFSRKTLVYVGKLEVTKGSELLFEAVKGLDIDMKIIGEGGLKEKLSKYAEDNNISVEFLNYIPNNEVMQYVKGADVFVIPSIWDEPLGRTIVEGVGIKANIISTDVGGTSEIIDDGKAGFLFDGTVEDLRAKIILMLEKGVPGSDHYLRFSHETVVKPYEEIYRA